jgi:hypothetical protein
MKNLFKIFLFLFLVLLVLSCSKKEYTEDGIKQICNNIDSLLHHVVGEPFEWGSGKAYSTFNAFFHDSNLIFINEKLKYRDGGEAMNWYYIYNNSMIQFVEKKIEIRKEGKSSKKSLLDLTAQITPSGDVLNYDKIFDGKREELTGEESKWIYNHSKELIEIVKKHSKLFKN